VTEEGKNWTVMVFDCPSDRLKRILVDLFGHIEKIKEAKIPHFTIRETVFSKYVTISFRVLRNQVSTQRVEQELKNFMEQEALQYQIDPVGNDHFAKCHAWIHKDETNTKWNQKRCQALNQLSLFVVSLAQNSLFDLDDRIDMGHLAINMLVLQEATVSGSNAAYYIDFISGKAKGQYLTFQIP
jgi:hypothetical protein